VWSAGRRAEVDGRSSGLEQTSEESEQPWRLKKEALSAGFADLRRAGDETR